MAGRMYREQDEGAAFAPSVRGVRGRSGHLSDSRGVQAFGLDLTGRCESRINQTAEQQGGGDADKPRASP